MVGLGSGTAFVSSALCRITLLGRYRDRRQQQLDSIEQLDNRLNKQIVSQSTQSESSLVDRNLTKDSAES